MGKWPAGRCEAWRVWRPGPDGAVGSRSRQTPLHRATGQRAQDVFRLHLGQLGRSPTGNHHDVGSIPQLTAAVPKPLANPALYTIAHHGVSDLSTHGESQTGFLMLSPRSSHENHESRGGRASTLARHILVLPGPADALHARQPLRSVRHPTWKASTGRAASGPWLGGASRWRDPQSSSYGHETHGPAFDGFDSADTFASRGYPSQKML